MFRPRHIISVLSGLLVLAAGIVTGSSAFAMDVYYPPAGGGDTGTPAVPTAVSHSDGSPWWVFATVALAAIVLTIAVAALFTHLRRGQPQRVSHA